MTDDDREWLYRVADALDKARRYTDRMLDGAPVTTISISHELAKGVADRLRAIAVRKSTMDKAVEPSEPFENIKTIAAWTGLPMSWLYFQAEHKKIPHKKLGKYLRFRRSEVAAWLEAQHQGPRSK